MGGTGGSTAGVGGATAGVGGSLGGTGGTAGTGTGGATAGTGGAGMGGATAGTGGAGMGGTTAGAAGAGMGGTTAGAAGAGMGGTAGMSGASMGGAGAGGIAGTSGTGTAGAGMGGMGGTGSTDPTPETIAPGLDGHLIQTPCGDEPNTDDCAGSGWKSTAVNNNANHICENGRLEANITFDVAGVAGTSYDVTMHFYGIMEPRQYSNVTREASGDPNLNGSTPYPWAEAAGGATITGSGDQNYNTYEIHVMDEGGQAVRSYFLNADNGTGHYTMLINYEKTIEVIGGGEIRLRVFDQNCRMIKNCGASGGTPCSGKARTVDIAGASPAPSMTLLNQPGLGKTPEHSGQWWLIDITEVVAAP